MQPAGGPLDTRPARGAAVPPARHCTWARQLVAVAALLQLALLAAMVLVFPRVVVGASPSVDACSVTAADMAALRGGVRSSFWHAYSAYTAHGLPADDLLPLSCAGTNASFGGMALTLIDAMDTLAVLGEWRAFVSAARYVQAHVSWDAVNATVSVFEVNIRAMGGLLSAHQLLTEAAADAGWVPAEWYPDYDGGLLRLAAGLGDRLVVAFETPTGVPYGSLHLRRGVAPDETTEASVAGGGTYVLELGTLSRLTGDGRYGRAAVRSAMAIFGMRAWTGLVGNHLDTKSGEWTASASGVGALSDSYVEYLLKGYVLTSHPPLLNAFRVTYRAIRKHIARPPALLDALMYTGAPTSMVQSSLAAFFPGLQLLAGDALPALVSLRAIAAVFRKGGCLPEGFHISSQRPASWAANWPLRPEAAESAFLAHWASGGAATEWVTWGRELLGVLDRTARVPCGYARVADCRTGALEDGMDSFLLSETFKYLYLLFDEGHWLRRGTFVFTTEAHPLWIPPVWSSEGNVHWPDGGAAGNGRTAPPIPSPAADTTVEPGDTLMPPRSTEVTTPTATAADAAAEDTGTAEPDVDAERERLQPRESDLQAEQPSPELVTGAPPPVILRPLPPPTCKRRSPLTPTPPPDVYGASPPPLTLFPNKCGLPPRLRASVMSGCGFGTPGVDAMPLPASALAVSPLPADVVSALRALGRPLSVGEVVTTRGGVRWRLVYASAMEGGHVVVDRMDDDEAVGDYPLPPPPLCEGHDKEECEGARLRATRRRPRNRAEGWGEKKRRRPRRKPPSAATAAAAAVGREAGGEGDGVSCSATKGGCACPRIDPWRRALGLPAGTAV
ncbi:hypothetical protein MMPV_003912 [Pyropia vietnamensis]